VINKSPQQRSGSGPQSRASALRRDAEITRQARARRGGAAREELQSDKLRQSIITAFEQQP
jgi:hypothetical protein